MNGNSFRPRNAFWLFRELTASLCIFASYMSSGQTALTQTQQAPAADENVVSSSALICTTLTRQGSRPITTGRPAKPMRSHLPRASDMNCARIAGQEARDVLRG